MSRMFASKYIFLTELGSSETRPEGMYYISRFNRQFRNKFSIDILSEEKMAEYKIMRLDGIEYNISKIDQELKNLGDCFFMLAS